MDPDTLKTYKYDGHSWIHWQLPVPTVPIVSMSPLPFVPCHTPITSPFSSPKPKRRGRPRIHPIKEKKRVPCAYNLYVKKVNLEGKYNHLGVQERMRMIAADWKKVELV